MPFSPPLRQSGALRFSRSCRPPHLTINYALIAAQEIHQPLNLGRLLLRHLYAVAAFDARQTVGARCARIGAPVALLLTLRGALAAQQHVNRAALRMPC